MHSRKLPREIECLSDYVPRENKVVSGSLTVISLRNPWVPQLAWESRPPVPCSERFLRQPGIPGTNDGLRTPGHLQFAENAGDMVAHRLGTEHQMFGNGRVGIALRDEGQHLPFALGYSGKR